jgi:phospholipid-binding lipoprotein MlaA
MRLFGLTTMALATLLGASPAEPATEEYDPWERVNRKMFTFNEGLDEYVLEPVAKGIDWAVPRPVLESVDNFFSNLRFPIDFANDLLQGKPVRALEDFVRFGVNTTFGLCGFFDPSSAVDLLRSNEDMGQTFAVWHIPPGPYLVVPVLGPMTVRDGIGLAGDTALTIPTYFVESFYLVGAQMMNLANQRTLYQEEIAGAKEASLDYYLFVRNAYYQRRDALIRDAIRNARAGRFDYFEKADEEDLYFLEHEKTPEGQ